MEEENKRIELERDLKEAELKSLHNQINSHFMFNSINTIANMARLEKAYKTEEFVYNFADMIRYSLRKDNSNTVYLEDELAYIENYLKIQKTRFGNRLEYTLDVDENFYNITQLPSLQNDLSAPENLTVSFIIFSILQYSHIAITLLIFLY